ncbi:MAG: Ldh family oxidoreductase [Candidatus Latescibacteria bacterium]|nr:Ldh family oxidoreductase [Candidatus Latescibacterota bacterium]
MNRPPEEFIRVPHQQLHGFVAAAGQKVGLPKAKAELLAQLLVTNDLRGVFSHGTQQIAAYAHLMREGKLNPDPQLQVVRETPCSVLVDGDGGLGYFPAHEGTLRAIEKAKAVGMAAMVSRNHGHFGAAGIYSRLAIGHDLIAYVTSGHQLHLQPDEPLYAAGGGSPMSFLAPTDQEDPLVLDFGALHDFYSDSKRQQIAPLAPGLVLRSIGMGEICQAWGGLLSGLNFDPNPPRWTWEGANQGALVILLRLELFADPAEFKRQMDLYVQQVRQLQPLPGFDQSHVPGGIEAARERQYRQEGVPVGKRHQKHLEKLAEELAIPAPWR